MKEHQITAHVHLGIKRDVLGFVSKKGQKRKEIRGNVKVY